MVKRTPRGNAARAGLAALGALAPIAALACDQLFGIHEDELAPADAASNRDGALHGDAGMDGGPVEGDSALSDSAPKGDADASACATRCTSSQVCCAGNCVDLNSDYENCGGCGIQCQPGNCKAGLCTLVSTGSPVCLTIGDASLYVADNNSIDPIVYSVPLSGSPGGAPDASTSVTYAPFQIVTLVGERDGSTAPIVAWTTQDTYVNYMEPPPMQPRGLSLDSSGYRDTFGIAASGNTLYWTDPMTGNIGIATFRSGPPLLSFLVQGRNGPKGIAVNPVGAVFWAENGPDSGGAVVVANDGGTATVLAPGNGPVGSAIAVDNDHVYWTTTNPPAVWRVSQTVGTASLLADSGTGGDPEFMTVHGGSVYWTDRNSGTVNVVPVDGGTAATIAQMRDHPTCIVADDESVYWTEHGAVMKAPAAK